MTVTATRIDIPTDDGSLPGLLWLPDPADGPAPGIVVLQEIFGLNDYLQQRCADLAALGYAVLAPQLFARLDPPVEHVADGEDFEAWLGRGMELTQQLDWDRATADALASLDTLRHQEQVDAASVGILGFCYGGGLAFAAAAAATTASPPPAVLVSFYGSALPNLLDLADAVTVPSLYLFGTEDDFIPMDQVRRIREAVTDGGRREQVSFQLYEGGGHAFDNPRPGLHHAASSEAAWRRTEQFLAKELPARG